MFKGQVHINLPHPKLKMSAIIVGNYDVPLHNLKSEETGTCTVDNEHYKVRV